jgi:hypothetical protein
MNSAVRDWKRQTFPLVFQRLSIQYTEKMLHTEVKAVTTGLPVASKLKW